MDAEAKQNALFDKKLAQEEVWIRQGIKARRTRNEGRVRALEKLRSEHSARRSQQGKANLQLNRSDHSGKQVVELENVTFAWPTKPIIQNFSGLIMRGDKVGIIGENGCGKSTLISLLLGKLSPTSGEITMGTNLQIAYFDQHRAQLDENKAVAESIIEGSDYVEINGQRKHIISYLADFLFSADRARQPVKALSGGERNRLLLARVFSKPSNLLLLDEPTNDLDIETLELLEELIMNYKGTVLIVSHDRAFLNNICTSSIVFDAPGVVNEYIGGYDDWLRQRPAKYAQFRSAATLETAKAVKTEHKESQPQKKSSPPPTTKATATAPTATGSSKVKLSYKDQRAYDALPAEIEAIETELEALNDQISHVEFYQNPNDEVQATLKALEEKETELEALFERWEILESKVMGE